MKRSLTTGLVLLAMAGATTSFGQSKRIYDDDIYYNSKTAQEEQPAQAAAAPQSAPAQDRNDSYSSEGKVYDSRNSGSDTRSNARSYDDDYVDYDNDDYYYSTRLNRFNNPFYNLGYYSTFNNPYWYDPFWVDPYWGWSPWTRPGLSISFGVGPYWSSYWGWQSWYGYGGFNSYYGYPGYGLYGGYYSGYWNNYYAGLYNNYGYGRGGYRAVTYGPRYSLNGTNNNYVNSPGFRGSRREARFNNTSELSTPRANGFRTANGFSGSPDRNAASIESANTSRAPVRSNDNIPVSIDRSRSDVIRSSDAATVRDRSEARPFDNSRTPATESFRNDRGAIRSEQMSAPAEQSRQGGGFFGRSDRSQSQGRTFERTQPQMEQRSAPVQRMDAPTRSFNSGGGGRSFGGGSGGGFGGGGGGFRGGRR